MLSNDRFFKQDPAVQELNQLIEFYETIPEDSKVLLVLGGGTAALTYLSTVDLDDEFTHVIMLGDLGYWATVAHRLAQPHHIFALPHLPSEEYIDPAEHDEKHRILPHETRSRYVHSHDYQKKLARLRDKTGAILRNNGKRFFCANHLRAEYIEREEKASLTLSLKGHDYKLTANKVVVATGAGPARKLSSELQTELDESGKKFGLAVNDRVFNYSEILSPVAEKCRNKDVIIYGGGATAAWAMEVAALTANPLAWIARHGFEDAIEAGPRVGAIIKNSESLQMKGTITSLRYAQCPFTKEIKIQATVLMSEDGNGTIEEKIFNADYVVNCIGQEQYELGGLPEMISPELKRELAPYNDENNVAGSKVKCCLGWINEDQDFMIIGAAQGTYYDKDRRVTRAPSVSKFIPRSGQVPNYNWWCCIIRLCCYEFYAHQAMSG